MSTDLTPGRPSELAPGVLRLVAPNPGMMTGPGTNTYILGTGELAVLDPGPADRAHLAAIREAATAPVRWILVTHTHPDHSPAAAILAAEFGATMIGRPPPSAGPQDRTFRPGHIPDDGELFETNDFALRAVHTPGHASNHLCYLHVGSGLLFTGDHILGGSTVVIDPPDGNMTDYLESLRRLRNVDSRALAPGHGAVIAAPVAAIDHLVKHRLAREAKVVDAVSSRPDSRLDDLVRVVYADVDASLHRVAERSLLAHLEKLETEGRVTCNGGQWRSRN